MNWKKEIEEFKKSMTAEPSINTGRPVSIGFFGIVGGGKSVTAGICAVGLTPTGSIGWVDGEGHRSAWAIDTVATMAAAKYGGTKEAWVARFKVVYVEPPFNPLRVIAAIEILEEAGCKTLILDILSAAWDSDGGYLDLKDEKLYAMAGEDEAKRKRSAAAAAAGVKPWTHQKLVNKITTPKTNLVLLFQAKQKFNASLSKPNDFQSPIQESGLTRTAIAVGLVQQSEAGDGGYCSFNLPLGQGTKTTHPDIARCLPQNGTQFTFENAEALLKLCGGTPNAPAQAPAAPSQPVDPTKRAKTALWDTLKPVRGVQKDWAAAEAWLRSKAILTADQTISSLTTDQIIEAAEKASIALAEQKPA